jgi:2-hydroxycyclohexanecarboxyl-CoA dehydrogenase
MVQKTLSEFKVIDILINNAGWDKVENFVDSTEETWDKVIAINLKGPIQCFKAVLPHMISRQYGKILSISSDAGRVGSSGEAVYSACKGGIIAFTKTLARETARYKINVNCIAPGPTDTPILEIFADQPKILEGMKRSIPFRRLAKPEDIANAVAFFVSDEAEFITGQTLSVSGGLTMI